MLTVNGCCCMSLRTAGLFIGWLWIAMVVLSITDTMNHIANDNPDKVTEDTRRHRSQNENIIALVFLIIDVFFTGLLIKGISANKYKLFLPWLIYRVIGLIIAIPMLLLLMSFASMFTYPAGMLAVLFVLFILGVICWSWVVVYSLYKEIQSNSMKPLNVPVFIESGPIGSPPPYQFVNKQLY